MKISSSAEKPFASSIAKFNSQHDLFSYCKNTIIKKTNHLYKRRLNNMILLFSISGVDISQEENKHCEV